MECVYAASKKKIRWVIGFTKFTGEVEITLIHSISSGKKVILTISSS